MTRILAQEDAARQLAVERSRQLSEWVLSTFNSGSSEALSLSALSSTDSFLLTVEPCFAWNFFAGRRRPCLPLLPPCAGGAPPRATVDRAARRLLTAAWPRLARALGRGPPRAAWRGRRERGSPERPAASREGGWRRGRSGRARARAGQGESRAPGGRLLPAAAAARGWPPRGAGARSPRARAARRPAGLRRPAPGPSSRPWPREGGSGRGARAPRGAGSRWGPKLGVLGLWWLATTKSSA